MNTHVVNVCLLGIVMKDFPILGVDDDTGFVDPNFRCLSIATNSKYHGIEVVLISCTIIVSECVNV